MARIYSLQPKNTWPPGVKRAVTFRPIYPHLRPTVTRHGPRTVNPSAALAAARAIARFCHVHWAHADTAAKLTWRSYGALAHLSAPAAIFNINIRRWYLNSGPTYEYPATETSTAITPVNPTATAIEKGVALYAEPDTTTWLWGFSVHRSLSTGFTASAANCIMLAHSPNATAFRWLDTPLPKTLHYYRLKAFTFDGVLGPPSSEISATPL